MIHRCRVWSVCPAESPEWLATQLTQMTWCGCSGFRLDSYVFVSDATSADGAQEYGVLRPEGDDFVQIESLTFSWMTYEQALKLIRRALSGEFDRESYSRVSGQQLQSPEQHGRCQLCA